MDLVEVSISRGKSPIVAQSNQLTEARYSLTVSEQRLVLTLLSLISPDDKSLKSYEIKISEFKELLGISTNTIYDQVKDVLKRLASRVIYIPEGKNYLIANWFSSAKYDADKGSVKISFDDNLKPYLLELKEQFTMYRLFVIAQFKSAYTIRIYMLLKQYERVGFREIGLDDFREMLGIGENEYPRFADFRKRVLNQAKKEFEVKNKDSGGFQSDITFDLETIRSGRKITRLRFNIKKQTYQEQLPIDLPDTDIKDISITPAQEALERYGIKGEKAQQYLDQQPEAEILRCVDLLEKAKKKGTVKSDSGYLLKLLDARAGQETEGERQQREAEVLAKQEAQKQALSEAQQKKQDKIVSEFDQIIIPEFLASLSETEQSELLATIRAEDPDNAVLINALDKGMGRIHLKKKIPDYEARKQAYLSEHL